MSARGYAASGGLPLAELAELAAGSERAGYHCFWMTVLAGEHDPASLIAAAAAATSTIELGLGLVPLDTYSGAGTARALLETGVDTRRIVCTLGVGAHHRGAAAFWSEQAAAFRSVAPHIRLAVGSYGPRVLHAGGRLADAVLVNWMTPSRARWALAQADAGAAAAQRRPPRPLYVLVSTASGVDGERRIAESLATYGRAEYHRRHQREMAATEPLGIVVNELGDADRKLAKWSWAMPLVNPIGTLTLEQRRELQLLCVPR